MSKKNITLSLLLMYLLSERAECQVRPSYETTVSLNIPVAPAIVITGGKQSVHYELHLTNFAKDTLEITGLAVLNATDSSMISKWDEIGLQRYFTSIGKYLKAGKSYMAPGASCVIFIDIDLPGNGIPKSLLHQLNLNILKNNQKIPAIIMGAATIAINKPVLIIGPPLAAGPWAAAYSPCGQRDTAGSFTLLMEQQDFPAGLLLILLN
jgi:murein DD-endopeptidase